MPFLPINSPDDAATRDDFIQAVRRRIITISNNRIIYTLFREQEYNWSDPEEWVRAATVAWLVVTKGYPANRIRLEVAVPRRTPTDFADIVVHEDDRCRRPYLVVENKASGQTELSRSQGIEQSFGNANSLRAPLTLYHEGGISQLYDVANFPPTERIDNLLGDADTLPAEYGNIPLYTLIAGSANDIIALESYSLESSIRRAHSLIWSGGRRDPLMAFDEWSKLLFAKVIDERTTQTGQPRRFQVGTNETIAAVASRIHLLFTQACISDPSIFPLDTRINLPDSKISEVVQVLQGVAFTRSDIDSIGSAFEQFFGSIFRGGLGQYFTMRQLARFIVAALNIRHTDFVLDPTAGSGGFLLECLLQVWGEIDYTFSGQPTNQIQRVKYDFAMNQVYGIEIHEILSRICKINLLLHHDGHTNIEGNRSVLDAVFSNERLNPPEQRFSVVVGNPPFGTEVNQGDEEKLGQNRLEHFEVSEGLRKVDSEQVIIEQSINMLQPGGRLGMIVPDGMLNNQGRQSNCPRMRAFLARQGKITGIVSLPDHAFRKSGAQNKTSIMLFEKFTTDEKRRFDAAYEQLIEEGADRIQCVGPAVARAGLRYRTFLGEANHVGYTPAGVTTTRNELYRADETGGVGEEQQGTILGEWRRFIEAPDEYAGSMMPDCAAMQFGDLWSAHGSNRLDPKYHLFGRETARRLPDGWIVCRLGEVLHRREDRVLFAGREEEIFQVMTISQNGEIRARQAGKGHNPPEWRGVYFRESPGKWYEAREGDVVFSGIDLWKGCIAVVPAAFDRALVSKEFPIYSVADNRLSPVFLQVLLRSRYYQRAFRAITTGHSNRRRTQVADFEQLEIAFPASVQVQEQLVEDVTTARDRWREAGGRLVGALLEFDNVIDGRGDEVLPMVGEDDEE